MSLEIPFVLGSGFLGEITVFNELCHLDKQHRKQCEKQGTTPSLWAVCRRILKWSYLGHKKLGSPIKTDHLVPDHLESKLKDMDILNRSGKVRPKYQALERVPADKFLENLVVLGFAKYHSESHGHSAIDLIDKGRLAGEILDERNPLKRLMFWIYHYLLGPLGALLLLVLAFNTIAHLISSLADKITRTYYWLIELFKTLGF